MYIDSMSLCIHVKGGLMSTALPLHGIIASRAILGHRRVGYRVWVLGVGFRV